MGDKPNVVIEKDGFICEWFSKRSELWVNIYKKKDDGTKGELVSELTYPKIRGTGPDDWMAEAVSIAKRELEKKAQENSVNRS